MKDIELPELSKAEEKRLKALRECGAISIEATGNDPIIQILLKRGLLERTCSNKFPYRDRGDISIPFTAYEISDAGLQFLNRTDRLQAEFHAFQRNEIIRWSITTVIAIAALTLSVLQQFSLI